jgi:hypothetical protein
MIADPWLDVLLKIILPKNQCVINRQGEKLSPNF